MTDSFDRVWSRVETLQQQSSDMRAELAELRARLDALNIGVDRMNANLSRIMFMMLAIVVAAVMNLILQT